MYVSVYPQGLPWPPALSMKVAKIRSLFTTKEHPYMPVTAAAAASLGLIVTTENFPEDLEDTPFTY